MAVCHTYFFLFFFKKKISVFRVTTCAVTQQEPLPHVELKSSQLPAPEKLAASLTAVWRLRSTWMRY